MNSVRLNLPGRCTGFLRTLWHGAVPTRGGKLLARDIYLAASNNPIRVFIVPTNMPYRHIEKNKSFFLGSGSDRYARALRRAGVATFTVTQGISLAGVKQLLKTIILYSYSSKKMIAKLAELDVTVTLEIHTPAKRLIDGIDPDSFDCDGRSAWDYPELRARLEVAEMLVPRKPFHPMFDSTEYVREIVLLGKTSPYKGKLLLEKIARENPELHREIVAAMRTNYYD